jgi:outer membrane protein assembly factor BamB
MIRIRTGTSWHHDPDLASALRRAAGRARTLATRGIVDALAIEVDGVDLAAGRAEGALLPSLEELLRAIARVVAGAPHAAVTFHDGALELVVRRRGASALLTVVSLDRPSRVLARDVEVELDALSAAALEGAAEFCRELAEVAPAGAGEARRLRAAARDLRRTEAAPPPRLRPAVRARRDAVSRRPGQPTCLLEVADDEGVLLAYEGGRPDLGSLLAPGRVVVAAADGEPICAIAGFPFLVLRDLAAAAAGIVSAVRRGEAVFQATLARPGRAGAVTLRLDLAAGRASAGGPERAAPPLALARAFAEAALDLGRLARARNPRQTENAYLTELEASAAERLAQVEELEDGDRAAEPGTAQGARTPPPPRVPREPLGPGRLRRLSFRRAFSLEVGAPVGAGLHRAAALLVVTGADAVAVVERATGRVAWRAPGAPLLAVLPWAVLAARGSAISVVELRSGRLAWERPLPGDRPSGALALPGGPLVLVEPGALTGLDPGSGRTLWRLELPGTHALAATALGGLVVAASDAGFAYGVDGGGRIAWRVRCPGPTLGAPTAAAGACLVLAEAGAGSALLALEPETGRRRWEALLDLVPSGAPVSWGRRLAVAGTVGGDPVVTALDRGGAPAWSAAPALTGVPVLAPADTLLAVRDAAGGLVALGRDGEARWSRAAPSAAPAPGTARPVLSRGALLVAGDGVACLDARTGQIVGAIPDVAPVRLAVDAALSVVSMDADGLVSGFRLSTHLSVL